jgi:hypothetical protein
VAVNIDKVPLSLIARRQGSPQTSAVLSICLHHSMRDLAIKLENSFALARPRVTSQVCSTECSIGDSGVEWEVDSCNPDTGAETHRRGSVQGSHSVQARIEASKLDGKVICGNLLRLRGIIHILS